MKRIYCDYAATTPVDPRVFRAMRPYFDKKFGNAGSLHWFGQEASAAIFEARQKIAASLHCDYKEIIFTGSATEANNLALRGVFRAFDIGSRKSGDAIGKPRIIVSAIEHGSILETARDLRDSVEIVYIPVSSEGIVDVKKIQASLSEQTILVSIQYANNEIGTIQPIAEIARIVREYRARGGSDGYPLFHVDAVQAFQYLSCRVSDLGVDLLTLSAHKIYGPKGIGLLYARGLNVGSIIAPIVTGGEQERGMRAGTENVPFIVGFGHAVVITEAMRSKESKRVLRLRDYCWKILQRIIPGIALNGLSQSRLPNNLNVFIPGTTTHELITALDVSGVAVSPGSACQARIAQSSYVIEALGIPDRSTSSIRLTFGRATTRQDIDKVCRVLKNTINKIAH